MPIIKFFDVLAPVIEQGIESIVVNQNFSRGQVYDRILDEIRNNRQEWFSNRVPNLNYCLPECRLAYLYMVAASNANVLKWILENDVGLRDYLLWLANSEGQIRVTAFGAGPGTELLALTKYFDHAPVGKLINIEFQLLDRVKEWMNSWFAIRNQIRTMLISTYGPDISRWPVIPNGNFVPCDLTEFDKLANLGNVWNQDVYILNFILSEVFNNDPGLRSFISTVANSSPQGSRFIFVERRGYRWQQFISNIARDAGLVLSPFYEARSDSLDRDENPEQFGDIYLQLCNNDGNPKQSWNVVYSIGIKQ